MVSLLFPNFVEVRGESEMTGFGLVLHLTRTSSPLITQAGLTCSAEGGIYMWEEALVLGRKKKENQRNTSSWMKLYLRKKGQRRTVY